MLTLESSTITPLRVFFIPPYLTVHHPQCQIFVDHLECLFWNSLRMFHAEFDGFTQLYLCGLFQEKDQTKRWHASWVKHLPAPANCQLLNEAQQNMPLQWRSHPVNPPLLSPMNWRATIQSSVMAHRRQRQEPASATSKFEVMAMLEPQNKKVLMEVSVKTVKSILNRQQLDWTNKSTNTTSEWISSQINLSGKNRD